MLPGGEGVYRFFIHKDSPIGRYNVSFTGVGVFQSYFYVVYDEFNYIEFSKHVFFNTEQFSIYLKHDTRIGLIFLKENLQGNYEPRGQTIYFEKGLDIGYYQIPRGTIMPSVGNWRVEMWDVNNRVPLRLLATHDCMVVEEPLEEQIAIETEGIGPQLHPVVLAIGGLLIVIVMELFPIALQRFSSGSIHWFVYAFMGATGVAFNVTMGWWPWWIIIFIATVGIIAALVMNKQKQG